MSSRIQMFLVSFLLHGSLFAEPSSPLTFERDIRPILREHCLDCHGADKEKKGDLDLRLRRLMIQGGESGPVILPGKPEKSLLIQKTVEGEMPPKGKKVSSSEIAILKTWILHGAKTARPEPESLDDGLRITPEERAFWSFQPIQNPEIPTSSQSDRVRNPIDAFVAQHHDSRDLRFNPDASKRTLIIRVYLDLIGIPPTPQQISEFISNDHPDAYSGLINSLLESPHYGERWGRHWLDVAGYADSEGVTNKDQVRGFAYKYRDYVIQAFNNNKPFDRFIIEQLAGDELVPPPHANLSKKEQDLLTATGFLRMAADGTGSGKNDVLGRNQTIVDSLKIVSSSLLGLTVGCAECHDHRYDPISQKDYYELRAIFDPAFSGAGWKTPQQRQISLYTDEDRKKSAEIEEQAKQIETEKQQKLKGFMEAALEKELTKYDPPLREQIREAYKTPKGDRNPEQKQLIDNNPSVNITPGNLYQYNQTSANEIKAFDKKIAKVRASKPKEEFIRSLTESHNKIQPTKIFHRGDPRQPTDEVQPAALTIFQPTDRSVQFASNNSALPTSGRRLAYAKWLVSENHPMVSRVLVNRVWLHHFGKGLVDTPDDFGKLGQTPTHPKLLDWLATDFMNSDWNLKELHKKILLSTVYRQSSTIDPREQTIDSSNFYYWRKPLVRLDAEVLRDRMLAASGELNLKQFGPPIGVKADDAGQIIEDGKPNRRSIYLQSRRSQPIALLAAFDAPVMQVNCAKRPSSTVATQSLMLLNNEFVLERAKKLAARAMKETPHLPLPAIDQNLNPFPPPNKIVWSNGYGKVDEATQTISSFTPYPHWDGSRWKGGEKSPDSRIGYSQLTASGGHTGSSRYSPIRRWEAPQSGKVTITGELDHPSPRGDGVRARIISSNELKGQWTVHQSNLKTLCGEFNVETGDVIDLVVDCQGNVHNDSFTWIVTVSLTDKEGTTQTWNSNAEFAGPQSDPNQKLIHLPQNLGRAWEIVYGRPPSPDELKLSIDFMIDQIKTIKSQNISGPSDASLTAMTNFCQTLLNSNEFLYID